MSRSTSIVANAGICDDDVETLLEMPDELADPERIVAARRRSRH